MPLFRDRPTFEAEASQILHGRYLRHAQGAMALLPQERLLAVLNSAWESKLTTEEAALFGAGACYQTLKQSGAAEAMQLRFAIDAGIVDVTANDAGSWVRGPKLRDRVLAKFEAVLRTIDE